jgi:ribosomal protein S12 methylthiotransferase accessory factor
MLIRPTFRPHLHVEIVPDEGIALLSETDHLILAQPLYARVAARLDGRHSADEIVAALSEAGEGADVRRVLDDLERRGLLTDTAIQGVPVDQAAFWASHGVDPGIATRRLAATAVSVDAVGDVALAPYLEALRRAGVRVAAAAERRVVITDDYLRADLVRINQEALTGSLEWLLMKPSGVLMWLGPVFRPGQGACWECLAARLRANRNVENFVAQRMGEAEPLALGRTITAMGEQIGAGIAASTVAAWVARNAAPELDGALVTLDLRSWHSETHRLAGRPSVAAAMRPRSSHPPRDRSCWCAGARRSRRTEATARARRRRRCSASNIT